MDIRLRVELLLPGADYFGAPGSQAEWENDVIWNDERSKPSWSQIAALDAEEAAELERQAALELLAETDRDMARAAEDILAALEGKGIIAAADLPAAVQSKMTQRRNARGKL